MRELLKCIKYIQDKKIIFFGTGIVSERLSAVFPYPIAYYVDNNPAKWGQEFNSLIIRDPTQLLNEEKTGIAIIIVSGYDAQIAAQLNAMGFEAKNHYWNGSEIFQEIVFDYQKILLEHKVNPKPRYSGSFHPELYELINQRRDFYQECLKQFQQFNPDLEKIPLNNSSDSEIPYWDNSWFSGLDAITLYAMMSWYKPHVYLEIGSGNSTKFAKKAIKDHNLNTQVISIDPLLRAEIDILCDKVIRKSVEDVDLDIFDILNSGDFLFIDNSHRCFTNSDVTVTFLDIIPRLKSGVIVEFHDIYLPYDYPENWAKYYFSEQYLLATFLLAGSNRYEILMPNYYICKDSELNDFVRKKWNKLESKGVSLTGGSFWLKIK